MVRGLLVIGLGALVAGCSISKLETGYVPNRLGTSSVARKGYYARPFSEKAINAKQSNDGPDRRPTWDDM